MKHAPWLTCLLLLALAMPASGHDTWVEPNTNLVRVDDVVHLALMLGNHGNHHRDFKLAGKVDPEHISLDLIAPDGERSDLKPRLRDRGAKPDRGYWSARIQPRTPGLYLVSCLDDKIVHYAPKRSIKSAKTFFLASDSLDKLPSEAAGFDR
ncbi:MAG: DUF4198 domain-containing protein, partial [Phycisphaeraceae bacterium]